MRVELGELGFDEGGALLIKRALRVAGPGGQISVLGSAPDRAVRFRFRAPRRTWGCICAPGAASKDTDCSCSARATRRR